MIQSNINEGIKTVLVLYQNQFKQGCEVHLDYGDLPSTLCYPDELNQVWTNLIHNALQAMHNEGELSISTKVQENNILVQFSDNGPGIPDDIQEKVFSSFFTTKPAGEGSGLGLGICKKIVDKHQGDIDFESELGRTTFSVSIPIRN
jgi:signal transduction histidine kinase